MKRKGMGIIVVVLLLFVLIGCQNNKDDFESKYNDLRESYTSLQDKQIKASTEITTEATTEATTKVTIETTKETTNSASTPQDSTNLLKIGDELKYDDWQIIVKKIEFHNTLSDSIAKGKYIAAIVTFTNNALGERRVGSHFIVKDELGRTFKMDTSASLDHHFAFDTESWYLADIGSSFSATMAIVFDVPLDAKNIVMYPTDGSVGFLLAKEITVETTVETTIETAASTVLTKKIETRAELQQYLEDNFSSLETSLGTTNFTFYVSENTLTFFSYDYDIWVMYDSGFFGDLQFSINVTSAMSKIVCQEIKDFQENLAHSVISALPDKKIRGGYHYSWYDYPSIREGIHIINYYSWLNYFPTASYSEYENSKITGFNWNDEDDSDLGR
ncbi:MAG: hypothetical protein P9M03_05500 [Candidatus Theseobacter exili]|nr:hypothetical protein [Candidatus Theseobacter exili]